MIQDTGTSWIFLKTSMLQFSKMYVASLWLKLVKRYWDFCVRQEITEALKDANNFSMA